MIIALILGFALLATHYIYYKFKDTRDQVSTSPSLKVTFHEKDGDQVTLRQIAPVTDSVGLSSRAYTFTIENNLETPVNYSIKIVKDKDKMIEDECGEYQIPYSIIKGAIHKKEEENHIFMLSDLKDNTILSRTLKGKGSVSYTLRFWTTSNSLTLNSDMHFHGRLQVVENGVDIATAIQ